MEIIYKLIDPETSQIRYIVKTDHDLDARMKRHLFDSKKGRLNAKNIWINSLILKGLEPIIEPICLLPFNDFSVEIESLIIRRLKAEGHVLLNSQVHCNKFYKTLSDSFSSRSEKIKLGEVNEKTSKPVTSGLREPKPSNKK